MLSAWKKLVKQRNRRAPVTARRNREPQGEQDSEKTVVSCRLSVLSLFLRSLETGVRRIRRSNLRILFFRRRREKQWHPRSGLGVPARRRLLEPVDLVALKSTRPGGMRSRRRSNEPIPAYSFQEKYAPGWGKLFAFPISGWRPANSFHSAFRVA